MENFLRISVNWKKSFNWFDINLSKNFRILARIQFDSIALLGWRWDIIFDISTLVLVRREIFQILIVEGIPTIDFKILFSIFDKLFFHKFFTLLNFSIHLVSYFSRFLYNKSNRRFTFYFQFVFWNPLEWGYVYLN